MADTINGNIYRRQDSIIRQSERIQQSSSEKKEVLSSEGKTFQDIFNRTYKNVVSLSKHASQRTEQRQINVTETDLVKLGEACDKAKQKGVKDALFMMQDKAFIVNTASKIVVTVMDKSDMNQNVITNIDGVLFL